MICDVCDIEDLKFGKEPINLQIRHINGTPVILCRKCRNIWYNVRHKIVQRYGTLSRSKKSREEVERAYKNLKIGAEEKVLLT
jgi:hypothetical protein